MYNIFNALTFIGTGEHLPLSGNAGEVFATTEGKSYVYISHGWEEIDAVSPVIYDEDEEYLTQTIICKK